MTSTLKTYAVRLFPQVAALAVMAASFVTGRSRRRV